MHDSMQKDSMKQITKVPSKHPSPTSFGPIAAGMMLSWRDPTTGQLYESE